MTARYLKQIHDISKEAGTEEPSLSVRMVGYEARMKLGSSKWTSSVQSSSSRAIIDVAKQAIADLQATAAVIQKNQSTLSDFNDGQMTKLRT